MQHFSISPGEMVASFWRNRDLIIALTTREVMGRYRGSFLGLFWSLFNPIFMLVIYTFVFSVIFKARWSAGSESKIEFALMLFAGLMVFNFFAECVTRAPGLIVGNVNYVKKVVFPLEILPWVTLGAALFHFIISLCVWIVACLIFFGELHLTALLLPLVMLPLSFFVMGLAWFLAALGVYLRDVGQIVGVLISMLMFLSPLFYPLTALPAEYRGLFELNPLTPTIEAVRGVLFLGDSLNWHVLGGYYLVAGLVGWVGFAWFQKTRKGFADVL